MAHSPPETEDQEIERLKREIIEEFSDGGSYPADDEGMDVIFMPRPGTLMLLNPPKKKAPDGDAH